jgi:hypothetical protein
MKCKQQGPVRSSPAAMAHGGGGITAGSPFPATARQKDDRVSLTQPWDAGNRANETVSRVKVT